MLDPVLSEWLNKIEGKLDQLHTEVQNLKRRASFWGAVSGALTAGIAALTAGLSGCLGG